MMVSVRLPSLYAGYIHEYNKNVMMAALRYIRRSLFSRSNRIAKLSGVKRELRWYMIKQILFIYPKHRQKFLELLSHFYGNQLIISNLKALNYYYRYWELNE